MASSSEPTPSPTMDDEDGMREACGVFACVAAKDWPTQLDVAQIVCLGLVGLQHRGQESAGIVTSDGVQSHKFANKRGMGLVSTIFQEDDMRRLRGNLGIGHTRYSTAGGTDVINCQPFIVDTLHGLIALAHNGEIVNANQIRQKLLKHGVGLSTYSDSELITQLLTHTPTCGEPDGVNWISRIRGMMEQAPLSYSLAIMHKDRVYAVRDPFGNRPLCIGKICTSNDENDVDGWVVSSESCSFQAVGARLHREVMPGEILEVSREGIKTMGIVPRPHNQRPATCIFEYVYFSRPDSIMEGQMVYSVRKRCGAQLAMEAPIDADLVATVPESATPAGIGYAEQLGLPYGEVLCKNRYVGRTFIQPTARLRKLGVAKKFGALVENLRGKRIVIIDDSIVRGTTMAPIIQLLRSSGALEVHVRVASPPIRYPCYMGINIPTREELIANQHRVDKLSQYFGADTLEYLSIDGLVSAVQRGISDQTTDHAHCIAHIFPRPVMVKIKHLSLLMFTKMGKWHLDEQKRADTLEYLSIDGLVSAVQRGISDQTTDHAHCIACLSGDYPVDPKTDW